MNFEGEKDASARRRTLDGHRDRTPDNASVASAISIEEYEEIVHSETHTKLPTTPYGHVEQ